MSSPFDATFKHLLEHYPADWLRLLGFSTAAHVEVLDADLSSVTAHADKIFRIDDGEPWILHLEPQASYEVGLPARVYTYNALIHRRHGLPVRSVILLLRKEATGSAITGVFRLRMPGEQRPYLEFRYGVIRVWRLHSDAVLQEGLGTLPLAVLADDARPRLDEVVQSMAERALDQADAPEAQTLISAAYILMGLRYSRDVASALFQGVRTMKESDTYQAIVEEGMAKGVVLGRVQGREEGRLEGRVEGQIDMLFEQGQVRWGEPDAATKQRVSSIRDPQVLRKLLKRLLDATSWQDLLGDGR